MRFRFGTRRREFVDVFVRYQRRASSARKLQHQDGAWRSGMHDVSRCVVDLPNVALVHTVSWANFHQSEFINFSSLRVQGGTR